MATHYGLGRYAGREGILLGSMSKTRAREASQRERTDDAEHRAYVEAWERAHPGQPFPRPWGRPEDARGWRAIARGRKWPARPEADVDLTVTLPPDEYVWLARQAAATGLRPSAY